MPRVGRKRPQVIHRISTAFQQEFHRAQYLLSDPTRRMLSPPGTAAVMNTRNGEILMLLTAEEIRRGWKLRDVMKRLRLW